MTIREQPHYFGAGPALLPNEVIASAANALVNYENLGIGIGEISHRSPQAVKVINDAKAKISKLLDIPETHEVFFGQGGGTGGFAAIPCNLLSAFAKKTGKKGKAGYLITGSWSQKAYEEATRLGADTAIIADAREYPKNGKKFATIPAKKDWKLPAADELAYVYYCDNETVAGVEFPSIPEVPEGVELVADMSSNIMSRKVDVSKFGLIFGGAQKNIGIAGVSFYVIKKSLLDLADDSLLRELGLPITPIFLDFNQIVKNNSLYNTASILAIYVVERTMQHLIEKGGLDVQQKEAESKAAKVYSVLDKYPDFYKTWVEPSVRSKMNIVFEIAGEGLLEKFLKEAELRKLSGLKGHRSVGGIRVSNYNAVAPESIDLLVKFMIEFAEQNSN